MAQKAVKVPKATVAASAIRATTDAEELNTPSSLARPSKSVSTIPVLATIQRAVASCESFRALRCPISVSMRTFA
jgi:hypothetical protein